MLTFAGKGYSPEFIANFERIASLIASGDQTMEIVFGPDDICTPILADSNCHCENPSVSERDRLAAEALADLLKQPVREDTELHLNPATLTRMREAFAAGTIRKACQGCQWSPFCDAIAEDKFTQTWLLRL
jgi:uncharacterized protein